MLQTPSPDVRPNPVAPRHIAIIMDGNNRWARREGLPSPAGHRAGVEAVRRALEACNERGIEVLTLFAFSSENWGRPEAEVRALLALFSRYLRRELEKLQRDNIRLRFIGRRDRFSPRMQRLMARTEAATQNNTAATLVLAVDYGGRWDLTEAAKSIARQVQQGQLALEAIDASVLCAATALGDLPEPDLCIRTGGDQRISNFLLWQFAYTELFFSPYLWPDFDGPALDEAITEYSRRERRYGLRKQEQRPEGASLVLRERVITGVILAALFLLTVIVLPTVWMAIVFGAVATIGAWEWAGMAGIIPQWQRCLYAVCLAPLLVALWLVCDLGGLPSRSQVQPWLGVACLFWSMTVLFIRSYPQGATFWQTPVVRGLMGLLILAATWLSVVFLKTLPGGAWLVILLIVGVASADIGAYFFGRRFGRHKLAPAVSPGKTWEGLWGGVFAVIVVTVIVWQSLPPSLAHLRVSALIMLGLSLAAASVLGDLTISMVKRTSGVKDSSGLLPGHGGVLDRIDSICGAAPVLALGLILVDY